MQNRIFRSLNPNLLKFVIALSIIALVVTGCSGGGGGGSDNQEVIISPNAVVLEDDTTQGLTSVSSDNSTLTFDSSTSTLEALEQDDVIIFGVTDKTPYGLLRKVTSITQEENQVVVETTQASLEDAIEEGTIRFHSTLTPNDVRTATALVGGCDSP